MKLVRDLSALPADLRGGAISIGNFDGVHRGHAQIVDKLRQLARQSCGPAVVFTFDPHPVRLLRPDKAPPPLTWTDRKAELLGELGVDAMIAYPTDEQLLQLSPETFFRQIVVEQLQAKAMVEGPNFFFGHNRAGNIELLGKLTGEVGLHLEVLQPVADAEGSIVSSSRVREAVAVGDVASALWMLGRPYRLRGMVTHGANRGRKLGFPTANLEAIDTLVPRDGVYAGLGLFNGDVYPAAIHIGTNPTFEAAHASLKVEVHMRGQHPDLYGTPLEVAFLERLRGNVAFDSAEQLQLQLRRDVEQAFGLGQQAIDDKVRL